jgi:hypothetical protein
VLDSVNSNPARLAVAGQVWEGGCGAGGVRPPPLPAGRSVPQSETAWHACDGSAASRGGPGRPAGPAGRSVPQTEPGPQGTACGGGPGRRARQPGITTESETAAEAQAGTASDSESQAAAGTVAASGSLAAET